MDEVDKLSTTVGAENVHGDMYPPLNDKVCVQHACACGLCLVSTASLVRVMQVLSLARVMHVLSLVRVKHACINHALVYAKRCTRQASRTT